MSRNDSEALSMSRNSRSFEKRVHEIDFFRGLLILLVVFDHLMNQFLVNNFFWPEMVAATQWYWDFELRFVIRFFALAAFCFISGISSAFSRNNWLRAGQFLVFWAVLAVTTSMLQTWKVFGNLRLSIQFNIIGVLAWSTLLYCFIQNKSWRSLLAMVIGTFLLSWYVIPWLQNVASIKEIAPYAPSIFKPTGTFGDWMPLFPFILFFMLGALLSYFVYRDKKESFTSVKYNWEKPFCFLGRHTLVIYLGHIVVLLIIFAILNATLGA